jgi:hypothetical protein
MAKADKPHGSPHNTFKKNTPHCTSFLECCLIHRFNPLVVPNQSTQPHRHTVQNGLKRKHSVVGFGNDSDDGGTGNTNGGYPNGTTSHKAQARQALLVERKRLPIWSGRRALVKAVQENDTLIVLGETGSGKTTRES